MSVYFLDTSAVAKRYLPETGSAWIQNMIDPAAGNIITISELATVEFTALLARRRREGSVSTADFSRLSNDFLLHARNEYRIIALSRPILAQARHLVTLHPLRSLDAIQLASALTVRSTARLSPTFISADQNLLRVAVAEGFLTDDPNAHP